LIDAVGREKIIWGSDYPLKIYPGRQSKPDFSTFRNDLIEQAKLSDIEQEAIFGLTFLSLLN